MKVLIYAIPADFHVHAVIWGLRHFGVDSQIWVPGDLPDSSTLTVHFSESGRSIRLRQGDDLYPLDDVQLVWNRRVAMPQAPEWSAKIDRTFIEDECQELVNGLRHLLGRRVPTINSPLSQAAAARKLVQIDEARHVGFVTVPTLVSNDFDEIAEFWTEHAPIIAKPFRVAAWKQGETVYTVHTATMPEPREEWRAELELCPQIFQKRVTKQKEVRLIAFGSYRFAAEVLNTGAASDDIRTDMRNRTVQYTTTEIPDDLQDKISAYMANLSILYGAFDFIIDDDGKWVFLECNESGQFLFLESALPDLGLLDAFCRWMCQLMSVPHVDRVRAIRLDEFSSSGLPEQQAQADWEVHKRGIVRKGLMIEDLGEPNQLQ